MKLTASALVVVFLLYTKEIQASAQRGVLLRPYYGFPGPVNSFQRPFVSPGLPGEVDPRIFFHGIPRFSPQLLYEYLPLLPKLKNRDGALDFVAGANPNLRGYLEFYRALDGVYITGIITGLDPGLHGFHVHQNGNLGDECRSAGGHFNPFKVSHGSPTSRNRHVGDLGNIFADHTGTANVRIFDSIISLDTRSNAFVGNRAIVVHALPDDLGRGGDDESLRTGNAGAREGCGIIYVQT